MIDRFAVLAGIQGKILKAGQLAAETTNLRKRSALLAIASAIKRRARELDIELEEPVSDPAVPWHR
jgi:hypothetical protein